MKYHFLIILLFSVAPLSYAKEMYRAPSAGDSGTYYVLKHEKFDANLIKVLTSRVGKNKEYTDFTELKINCESMQFFELAGGSEDGEKNYPTEPLKDWSSKSKWTPLVTGSSKYDLVNFICNKIDK